MAQRDRITKMRILILTQYYYPETFPSTSIAEGLARLGHEVDVLTGKPNYGFAVAPKEYDHINHEVHNGVNIYRVKHHKRKNGVLSLIWNYLSFSKASQRRLRRTKKKYDVVYGFNFSPIVSLEGAGDFAKKQGIPYLIHVFDLWPESVLVTGAMSEKSVFYKSLLRVSKNIYSEADAFLLSSPGFASYLKGPIGTNKKCITCYQPVDEGEPSDLSSPFGEGEKAIVYCGNLGRMQELDKYIEAISLLPSDLKCTLHIIGDGGKRKELEEEARKLNLDGKVFFHSHLAFEEAARYRRNSFLNIVTLKSTQSIVSETVPSKLLVALSDARPIIATISGDGAKMLRDSGGSFLPAPTPNDIAKAILQANSLSKDELNEMGTKNRKYYEENLSSEKVLGVIESTLLELIESAKK